MMANRDDTAWLDGNPDRTGDVSVTEHDWGEDTRLSVTVVETVADALDADPTSMPPIYEVIDLEALDALFQPGPDGSHRPPDGRVTFQYRGCKVTVEANGRTVVSNRDGVWPRLQ